jgi:hypothetical protein
MIERGGDMPTVRPRTMITFNDEQLYKMVDEFRFENRFKSQNEAIMALIDKGIEVLSGIQKTEPIEKLSDEDRRVLNAYRSAEPVYQGIALEILENHQVEKKKNRA